MLNGSLKVTFVYVFPKENNVKVHPGISESKLLFHLLGGNIPNSTLTEYYAQMVEQRIITSLMMC